MSSNERKHISFFTLVNAYGRLLASKLFLRLAENQKPAHSLSPELQRQHRPEGLAATIHPQVCAITNEKMLQQSLGRHS